METLSLSEMNFVIEKSLSVIGKMIGAELIIKGGKFNKNVTKEQIKKFLDELDVYELAALKTMLETKQPARAFCFRKIYKCFNGEDMEDLLLVV